MCGLTKRLDRQLDHRITQDKTDLIDILQKTEIINGKAIDEAIEFGYYDSKTAMFNDIADSTNYTAQALKKAHQSYSIENTLREANKAKELETHRQIQEDLRANKIAETEAKELEKLAVKSYHQTETKLKGLSDSSKRALGKGITDSHNRPQPQQVQKALEVLVVIPPKATAKDIKLHLSENTPTTTNRTHYLWEDSYEGETFDKLTETECKRIQQIEDQIHKLREEAQDIFIHYTS